MKIGAHISIGKGIKSLTPRVKEMGADCLQIFVSPPRNWNPPKWNEKELNILKDDLQKAIIGPNFLHGIYLVNLHTTNPEMRTKAIESVVSYMRVAEAMGAEGVIIHSHRPDDTFKSAIEEILDQSPTGPLLIIEHSAITTIEQTLELFNIPQKKRLGLCLDTCHLFAAGYDIRNKAVIDGLLDKIHRAVGLSALKVIHTNDAKSKLGSKRDHHENIGEGSIGKAAFKLWLNHPKLKNIPFIIEVPGFDDKGPDKQNIDILKSLL